MMAVQKILVVDDVGINRLIPGMILRPFGYAVHEVPNGQDALAQLQTEAFDLVLLDLSMPGVHGSEVLSAQAQNPSEKKPFFVAYTAIESDDQVQQLLSMGFDRVLAKPAKTVQLLYLVNELADSSPNSNTV